MPKLATFEEALSSVEGGRPPHVLLGNGFSRACRDDIFSYDALLDQANFDDLSPFARRAFDALDTTDFEVVMRALRRAADLVMLYDTKRVKLTDALRNDADGLREVLVQTIARNHPSWPGEIAPQRYAACKRFLSNFERIFTLNYDLLLYWALMQDEVEPAVRCDDGFRKPDLDGADYVTWEPENSRSQNVYYLHGALHVFDATTEIQKFTWKNTGVRLIDQIRLALELDRFPIFVAEGESAHKVERVRHSDFLSKAFRSLLSLGGSLFVFGHSLAPNDAHVFRAIEKSKVASLFVGIYGKPTSAANKAIMERANLLGSRRSAKWPLVVTFYDAGSVSVWG